MASAKDETIRLGPDNDEINGEDGKDFLAGEEGDDACDGGGSASDQANDSCERRQSIP